MPSDWLKIVEPMAVRSQIIKISLCTVETSDGLSMYNSLTLMSVIYGYRSLQIESRIKKYSK